MKLVEASKRKIEVPSTQVNKIPKLEKNDFIKSEISSAVTTKRSPESQTTSKLEKNETVTATPELYMPWRGTSSSVLWALKDLTDARPENYFTPSEIYNRASQYTRTSILSNFWSTHGQDGVDSMIRHGYMKKELTRRDENEGKIALTKKGGDLLKQEELKGNRPSPANKKAISKRERKYTPKYRSGAYAILKYLLYNSSTPKNRDQICTGAQKYADALFYNQSQHEEYNAVSDKPVFSAYDSINTLTAKCLVIEQDDGTWSYPRNNYGMRVPNKMYKLSSKGLEMAVNLR